MLHSERRCGRIAVRARVAHQHTALSIGLIDLRLVSLALTASVGVPCKRSERSVLVVAVRPLANGG